MLASQLDKLQRAEGASAIRPRSKAALAALEAGARGKANLLALSVEAARAHATVGEISLAMERVFGRHQAKPEVIRGVYAAEVGPAPKVARGPLDDRRLRRGRRPRRRPSWSPRWARTATTAARR